jgi:ABC-type amino acid transport substrate-binding protein
MTLRGARAVLAAAALAAALPGAAVGQEAPEPGPLRVAVVEGAPFAMRGPDGAWEGLSVDLWDAVAAQAGIAYVWADEPGPDPLAGLAAGSLDLAIGVIGPDAETERRADFSHPYYVSPLGIALRAAEPSGFRALLRAVSSTGFIAGVVLLAAMVAIFGFLMRTVERRANPGKFGDPGVAGLGQGMWWAVVTLATVGYGDSVPITRAGRLLASAWMILSMVVMVLITGHIAASLTTENLSSPSAALAELPRMRVGVREGPVAGEALRGLGVRAESFGDVAAGLEALQEGRIDAFVADWAELSWTSAGGSGVLLSDVVFEPQALAFALPLDGALRKPLNVALLEVLDSPAWIGLQQRYLASRIP